MKKHGINAKRQRPTGARGTRMHGFSIQVPEEVKRRADAEAKKRGISRAALFAMAFANQFPAPEPIQEPA